jgi:hypothetical protein
MGREILDRKAKRAKLHRTPIVSSKAANKQKILNNIRCDKNIIKVEWDGKGRVKYCGSREGEFVPHNDR